MLADYLPLYMVADYLLLFMVGGRRLSQSNAMKYYFNYVIKGGVFSLQNNKLSLL